MIYLINFIYKHDSVEFDPFVTGTTLVCGRKFEHVNFLTM